MRWLGRRLSGSRDPKNPKPSLVPSWNKLCTFIQNYYMKCIMKSSLQTCKKGMIMPILQIEKLRLYTQVTEPSRGHVCQTPKPTVFNSLTSKADVILPLSRGPRFAVEPPSSWHLFQHQEGFLLVVFCKQPHFPRSSPSVMTESSEQPRASECSGLMLTDSRRVTYL